MINRILPKLVLSAVCSMALSFTSLSALANTAPVFNFTGEKSVSTYTIEPDIDSTDSYIPVDMDGDGDLDILLLARGSISWYENGNDWNETYIIHSYYGYNDIMAVGDMDGDGDIDIITSSSFDDEIYLYENDFQWTKTSIVNDIEFVKSIKINDMDGDGDLDIVVLGGSNVLSKYYTDDVIIWYENGSSWAENIIKLNGYEPEEIIVADMDGDGDFDVLYTNDNFNKIGWLENETDNDEEWSENIISSSYDVEDIKAVDIDSDGDLDVLVGEEDAIHWLENGNSWTETSIVKELSDLEGLDFSDINGDGQVDILSAYYGSYRSGGSINLYQGLNWSDSVISNRTSTSIQPINVLAVDMDNDGDMDVVTRSYNYSNYNYLITLHTLEGYDTTIPVSVEVLEGELNIPLPLSAYDNDGDALTYSLSGDDSEFFKVSLTGVVSFITAPDYHLFSDFNKDNVFELLFTVSDGTLSSSKKVEVEVLLGQDSDSDGITDAQELLDGTDPDDYDSKIDTDGDGVPDRLEVYYGGDINSPDAIDSDGDGVSDYIEQYYGEDDAPVWLSKINNAEHWVEKEVPSTSNSSYYTHNDVEVADITGDGVKDILSQYDDSIVIFDRANDFSALTVDDSVYGAHYITVADLSNDGVNNPDIITKGGRYNRDIYWYEHDTWIKRPISTSRNFTGDLKVHDMDSDGDLDIVTVLSGQAYWFENGNTWLEHSFMDFEGTILRFEMLDFDLDGDTDIVATIRHNYDADEVVWFESGASWEKHVIINSVEEPDGLAVKDIDGDGSLDIVVTSDEDSFTLLKNKDGWQETKLYSLHDGDDTSDVVITDMNNDGVLDIVGSSSSSLVWFNGANDWSRIVIDSSSEKKRIIVDDLIGDSNKDVIGSTNGVTYGNTGLFIHEATNIVTKYSLEVPDLSPEIKLPFVALDLDGQDLTYLLEGDDANYFTVDNEGVISFASQLSIGKPVDFDGNNIFDLYLIANDEKNYSIVTLSLTLVKSIDTDGDGILDSYDIDDDNDLVPDTVEIKEGTDPLDASSFLDEDKNGVPDFVQKSKALYINYHFPLGMTMDEGSFAVVDLSNVTSVNGPVSVVVSEVQGLNYKFRDNVVYIYADYVMLDQTVDFNITLSDGIEVIEHVFPVFIKNVLSADLKIELIREASVIDDTLRLQVATKNMGNTIEFKWYIDDELLTAENSQMFILEANDFKQEDIVIKVEVSNDGFVSKYVDGMELNRTLFLAEVEQAKIEQTKSVPNNKNVAGSISFISLLSAILLLLLRKVKLKLLNQITVIRKTKLFVIYVMLVAVTACSSTTEVKYKLSDELAVTSQSVNIELDDNDPLFMAKQEYEAEKERLKLKQQKLKIEKEKRERNERIHILTIGF